MTHHLWHSSWHFSHVTCQCHMPVSHASHGHIQMHIQRHIPRHIQRHIQSKSQIWRWQRRRRFVCWARHALWRLPVAATTRTAAPLCCSSTPASQSGTPLCCPGFVVCVWERVRKRERERKNVRERGGVCVCEWERSATRCCSTTTVFRQSVGKGVLEQKREKDRNGREGWRDSARVEGREEEGERGNEGRREKVRASERERERKRQREPARVRARARACKGERERARERKKSGVCVCVCKRDFVCGCEFVCERDSTCECVSECVARVCVSAHIVQQGERERRGERQVTPVDIL